jgi:hypothetical protein
VEPELLRVRVDLEISAPEEEEEDPLFVLTAERSPAERVAVLVLTELSLVDLVPASPLKEVLRLESLPELRTEELLPSVERADELRPDTAERDEDSERYALAERPSERDDLVAERPY